MPHQRLKPENFLDEERLVALKNIIPEACADNKINWSTLKGALGGELEDEEKPDEHFGLILAGETGSAETRKPSEQGNPYSGEGGRDKRRDHTEYLHRRGEPGSFKILRKSYAGRIKMIYIDPPYNTGNDFVYDDDFTEPLNDYLKRTGQIDGEGRPLTTNKKADGRFHSKWLSMMYPRLRLARELLRDDGVIFVSIDDNEVHHLRMMMNEVFGEENFEGHIHWRRRHNQPNDPTKMIALVAEHIIAYSKNKDILKQKGVGKIDLTGDFSNPDNDPTGDWASNPWKVGSDQSGSRYVITNPNTGDEYDEEWMGDENTYKILLNDNRIIFPHKGKGLPRKKYFRFEREKEGQCAINWWTHKQFGNNQAANDEMTIIFDGKKSVFSNPKPKELIRGLIQISNAKNTDIILDFFSGSATTAHAVLDLNREDGGNRKFILVQMPEETDEKSEAFKAGYRNIAEIGKERIRRVIKKIESKRKEELPGHSDENGELNIGFKVFKLTSSNYKPWENYHGESVEKLEELFEEYEVPLVDKWKEVKDGLFTEILLLEGFPLDSIVTEKSEYTKNQIRQVKCSFHENRLLVCLDDKLASETIRNLELADGDTFVCLDTAIDDQAKSRLADKGMIKTI